MNAKHRLIVLMVFSLSCMGASCGGSDSRYSYTGSGSSGQNGTTYDYNGPGSAWTVLLDEYGSFYVTESAALGQPYTMTVEGTYSRNADSGFIELTVTEATGDDAPDPGDTTAAIEVEGFSFVLQPFGQNEPLIPMVVSGACSPVDIVGNWVTTSCTNGGGSCDADSATVDYFGSFLYDESETEASFPSRYTLQDGTDLGAASIGAASCSSGVMQPAGAVVYMNDESGSVVHVNPADEDNAQHMMVVPQEELVAGSMNTNYIGFAYDNSDSSSVPVSLYINTIGLTGAMVDVDPDNLNDLLSGGAFATLTIDEMNQVQGVEADGFMTMTYTAEGEAARPMYCTAATSVAGSVDTDVMVCAGQSPLDAQELYSLILVSDS